MKRLVLVVALALPACGMMVEREAEKAIAATLIDPESARFSLQESYWQDRISCGLVVGKNTFGGYAPQPAAYVYKNGEVTIDDGTKSMNMAGLVEADQCRKMVDYIQARNRGEI